MLTFFVLFCCVWGSGDGLLMSKWVSKKSDRKEGTTKTTTTQTNRLGQKKYCNCTYYFSLK